MKTRNLLILAFLCGMAILIAGTVKLFQVATDKQTVTALSYGETAEMGDVTVRVTDVTATPEATLAHVEIRGVDGDDVGQRWRMIADGTAQAPIALPAGQGASCADTQVGVDLTCTVAFAPVEGPFVIAYSRGGTQTNWAARDS